MTRRSICLLFTLLLTISIMGTSAPAKTKPIQLALVTPIQIFPESTEISGVRLNLLYGRNVSVTGLDIGLVNHSTTGISKGVQFGVVGLADSDFVGWQNNSVNITNRNFEGFQWGAVNYANYANGFQLGIVNYARSMKGLQIGLVNIIKQGGQFPVFPIVNWSF
jgi:hypothetical protein